MTVKWCKSGWKNCLQKGQDLVLTRMAKPLYAIFEFSAPQAEKKKSLIHYIWLQNNKNNHINHKWKLASLIYSQVFNSHNWITKNPNNPTEKWAEDLNRQFSKEDI